MSDWQGSVSLPALAPGGTRLGRDDELRKLSGARPT